MDAQDLHAEFRTLISSDGGVLDWLEADGLDGIWFWDLTHRERCWFSPGLGRTFGFGPEDAPDPVDWWRDRIEPEDLERLDLALEAHLERDEVYDQVVRCRHRDEHILHLRVRGRAIRDADGRPVRMLGVTSDVSARVTATDSELELTRTRELLELAQRSAGVGLFDWDIAGDRGTVSDTWLDLVGLERAQLTDASEDWWGRIHPEDLPAVRELLDAHLHGERDRHRARYRMRHSDGTWRWMESDGRLVERTDDGRPKRMIGILRDVSQQVATEDELHRAVEHAEAGARAKADFLATMSHEIRTPLNGVIGMTEVLLKQALPAPAREYAETIQTSGELLLTVINDVLDFAKSEAGKLLLEEAPFDPRTLVDHVVTLFAPEARKSGIELSAVVEAMVPGSLLGDETRLRQVLNNLVSNAIKFTESGTVELIVAPTLIHDRQGIELIVRDTGIGMSPAVQERIFKPFVQGETSTTRRFGGTGLGLAITERLVALMDGSITCESSEGEGTAMRVALPLRGTVALPAPQRDLNLLEGRRVLHVDDNPVNIRIVRELCASWGVGVVSCPDAIQALRQLRRREQHFDCLVSDLQMPDIDGLMLLNLMHNDPDIGTIPAILLSSGSTISLHQQARALGFVRLVTKPVRQAKLLEALLAAFSGEPPEEEAEEVAAPAQAIRLGRVLVAEDNPINQQLLQVQLQGSVDELVPAEDGLRAVEAALAGDFELILMDCQMPNLDGLAATRAIRADERARRRRRVPIIALTANAMPGDRERCLQAGMDDYLAKPVHEEDLMKVLARWHGVTPQTPPQRSRWSSQTMAALDLLHRSIGDRGLRELVNVTIRTFARQRASMTTAVQSGDLVTVDREAHSIKGSAAGLGLTPLAEVSDRLCQAARAGENRACRELHRDWLHELDLARELMDELRQHPEHVLGRQDE